MDLLGTIGDAYAVWGWLTRPNALLDGTSAIDRLRSADPERVADVTSAAEAELDGAYR